MTAQEIQDHRTKAEAAKAYDAKHLDTCQRPTPDLVLRLLDTIEVLQASNRRAPECAEREKGRADRAEAIVARLPKTADGVPITPGMAVYFDAVFYGNGSRYYKVIECEATGVYIYDGVESVQAMHDDEGDYTIECDEVYSTRAAAEAALAAKK